MSGLHLWGELDTKSGSPCNIKHCMPCRCSIHVNFLGLLGPQALVEMDPLNEVRQSWPVPTNERVTGPQSSTFKAPKEWPLISVIFSDTWKSWREMNYKYHSLQWTVIRAGRLRCVNSGQGRRCINARHGRALETTVPTPILHPLVLGKLYAIFLYSLILFSESHKRWMMLLDQLRLLWRPRSHANVV